MIEVSCIIINYNTSQLTQEAINSILQHADVGLSYEIVVVDNASQWEDYTKLKRFVDQGPDHVKLYRSRVNTGFGGGNMMGVQYAAPCKYYAFINNDILFIQDQTLSDLRDFMENQADAGVCSPQMLDENENFRATLDHFATPARQILKRGFLEKIAPQRYPDRKAYYDQPQVCDYVQGSFMFVQADAFNAVGGFDTNIFLYYEESDLCRRILKKRGLRTYLFPQQSYIHYKGGSTSKSIDIKIEQKISLLYLLQKHHGVMVYLGMLGFYIIKYFFSSILKPKNWKLFKVLLQGAPLSKSLRQSQIVLEF
ncbi:glycosyltransferase family 2 protein [Nonlabens xiamenensis]|uniref:glycosyltransferase family 2 protein n=1 Tax=Nonlabens xiamenensis TaxID=2341043 RepID=UPI0013DE6D6F|nr:glycosyltransferase family 2 protein [Nonlabens xiamenensis]